MNENLYNIYNLVNTGLTKTGINENTIYLYFDSNTLYFQHNNVDKDEVMEINEEFCSSIENLAHYIYEYSEDYDVYEEKKYYTPGMNGTPEEPKLTEEFELIKNNYEKLSDVLFACIKYKDGETKAFEEVKKGWKQEIRNKKKSIIHKAVLDLARQEIPKKEIKDILEQELNGIDYSLYINGLGPEPKIQTTVS